MNERRAAAACSSRVGLLHMRGKLASAEKRGALHCVATSPEKDVLMSWSGNSEMQQLQESAHRLESVYSQVCLAGHLSTQTHQSKLEIAYSKLASATEAKRRLVSEWASDSEVAVRLSDRHPVSSSLIMGRPCSGRRSRNYR